jgi:hypothetical protein
MELNIYKIYVPGTPSSFKRVINYLKIYVLLGLLLQNISFGIAMELNICKRYILVDGNRNLIASFAFQNEKLLEKMTLETLVLYLMQLTYFKYKNVICVFKFSSSQENISYL